jgi:hypothetical protein
LKDVAESVGGEVSEDIFMKVYEKAIGEGKNHEFLFIDLHKKPHHPIAFVNTLTRLSSQKTLIKMKKMNQLKK